MSLSNDERFGTLNSELKVHRKQNLCTCPKDGVFPITMDCESEKSTVEW